MKTYVKSTGFLAVAFAMLGCAQRGNDPFVIRIIGPAEACSLNYKGKPIPHLRDLATLAKGEVRKGRTALIDSDLKRTPIGCFLSPMNVLERVGFEKVRYVGGALLRRKSCQN